VRRRQTRRNSNGAHENGATAVAPPRPIRVLIADRDELARNALRGALGNGRLSVVGQAADTPQALSLATRCAPDVVLLDETLPPAGGLAAMDELSEVAPDARVILLGRTNEEDAGLQALSHGAAGYLSRAIDLGSLPHAVEGVMAGEAAISRALAGRLILSPDTVHSHVQHILRKLHAHSRAEAIAIAERSNGGFATPA
jgi:DNA-binding NarL/FixJ family response regulator